MSEPISNDQREFQEQNAATDQRNLNSDRWDVLVEVMAAGSHLSVHRCRDADGYCFAWVRDYEKLNETASGETPTEAITALVDLLVAKRYERGEGT